MRELSPSSRAQTRQSTFYGFGGQVRALNSWIRRLLISVFSISALVVALVLLGFAMLLVTRATATEETRFD